MTRTHASVVILAFETLIGCGSANLTTAPATSDPPPSTSTLSPSLSSYWTAPAVGTSGSLGTINVPDSSQTFKQLHTLLVGGASTTLTCTGSKWNSTGTKLDIFYSTDAKTAVDVSMLFTLSGKSLQIDLSADQPVIASVNFGAPSDSLGSAVTVPVPYYSGTVWYVDSLGKYVNSWWDWKSSSSTSIVGNLITYSMKTDGTYNKLHEIFRTVVSPTLSDVLPSPGNSPSTYVSDLSGRTVLDIWDHGFPEIAQGLSDLADYGIGNCVAIIHDWQSAGFDNAFPDQFPANEASGGGAVLAEAVQNGKTHGCRVALHENYADYYPNSSSFTTAAVAVDSTGKPIDAHLNPVTGIQSYATKPTWMVTNASTQAPLIHKAYGTNASFIDVNSAVPPGWRADMDSHVDKSGMAASMWDNDVNLWNYEKQTHGGPVFGEGGNHWYYSGLLDGVEARVGAGPVAANLGSEIPLLVDFDLLRIHPLQVNNGMGYYERWSPEQVPTMTRLEQDAYRMQEVIFGHAPFLYRERWNSVPDAFVEANLVSPVASIYGPASATQIAYKSSGNWVDSSTAVKSGDLSQVQVTYSGGMQVVANSSTSDMSWNGLTLPQYGWAAKGSGLLAYTAKCGSSICDFAQTSTSLFANARNQDDARRGWGYAAPTLLSWKTSSDKKVTVVLKWEVYRKFGVQRIFSRFIQLVDPAAAINNNDAIVLDAEDYSPRQQARTGE